MHIVSKLLNNGGRRGRDRMVV